MRSDAGRGQAIIMSPNTKNVKDNTPACWWNFPYKTAVLTTNSWWRKVDQPKVKMWIEIPDHILKHKTTGQARNTCLEEELNKRPLVLKSWTLVDRSWACPMRRRDKRRVRPKNDSLDDFNRRTYAVDDGYDQGQSRSILMNRVRWEEQTRHCRGRMLHVKYVRCSSIASIRLSVGVTLK